MPPRIPVHSKDELNQAAVRAQTGSDEDVMALLAMMRPYMVSILRQVDATTYTLDQRLELDSVATLGVIKALRGEERIIGDRPTKSSPFDASGGTKFSTWAHPYILHEVSEWLAHNTGTLALPKSAWQYADRIEDALPDGKSPHDLTDDDLTNVEIQSTYRDRLTTVPYAGEIFRARKSAFPIDPNIASRHSPSAEDEAILDDDSRALRFIESLDSVPVGGWPEAVEDYLYEQGLNTDAAEVLDAAYAYLGRTP